MMDALIGVALSEIIGGVYVTEMAAFARTITRVPQGIDGRCRVAVTRRKTPS